MIGSNGFEVACPEWPFSKDNSPIFSPLFPSYNIPLLSDHPTLTNLLPSGENLLQFTKFEGTLQSNTKKKKIYTVLRKIHYGFPRCGQCRRRQQRQNPLAIGKVSDDGSKVTVLPVEGDVEGLVLSTYRIKTDLPLQ
ncbi:hypothetical protein SLEP1_g4227 [Rubroshorea leprosula]|uniref:Uncharacterized protein n=1 Tax=Rubroshorea leprosula TaxID=152421 RepID=A0AAV5HN12_9ROSI|nr:hypothetical protein SLEP1_g4227 [Rubroshorea leprosula]